MERVIHNLWTSASSPQTDLNPGTMIEGPFSSSWLCRPLVTVGKNFLGAERPEEAENSTIKSLLRDLAYEVPLRDSKVPWVSTAPWGRH